MQHLLDYIFSINDGIKIIISAIMSVIAVIDLISIFYRKGEQTKNATISVKQKVIILVCLLLLIGMAALSYFCTRVPDVREKTYEDAVRILSDSGLRYSLDNNKNKMYIDSQDPNAGSIVRRNTKVSLTTKEVSSNPEVIKSIETKIAAEYTTFTANLFEQDIAYYDLDGNKEGCAGLPIENPVIEDAYLIMDEHNIKYDKDYKVEGNSLVFSNIPKGMKYTLHIELEGYSEIKDPTFLLGDVNDRATEDGRINNCRIATPKNNSQFMPVAGLRVFSEDGTPIESAKVTIDWYRDGVGSVLYTDKDGALPLTVNTDREITIPISVEYPADSGNTFKTEAQMRYDKEQNPDVIIVKRDGTFYKTNEKDYFGW